MSRSRYLGLERAETAVLGFRATVRARRRAVLEEELVVAYAEGDQERVSPLRGELTRLEAPED